MQRHNGELKICRMKKPDNSLLYATVQMMEANEAAHPLTNALKMNGQIMTTLVHTGSCVVRLYSFPKEAIFLERKGYDGSNIISVTGHALNVDSTLGRIVIRHEVILVEGITYDCVLGMDLLEKN